jgi:hypothetical protein
MECCSNRGKAGGAEGIRTPDLLIANETLYQLSYDPIHQDKMTVSLGTENPSCNSVLRLTPKIFNARRRLGMKQLKEAIV